MKIEVIIIGMYVTIFGLLMVAPLLFGIAVGGGEGGRTASPAAVAQPKRTPHIMSDFDRGIEAYYEGDEFETGRPDEWKAGWKDSWYRENRLSYRRDPDGIETDRAWDLVVELAT